MEQQTFTYNQMPVTFFKGDNVMVNATQMAKAFGKQPSDWTRLMASGDFLDALSVARGIPRDTLINSSLNGTFFHEDVAIEFARWLAPAFAIWCNDMIKSLIKNGSVSIPQTKDAIIKAGYLALMEENEELKTENKALLEKNGIVEAKLDVVGEQLDSAVKTIKDQASDVKYTRGVLNCPGLIKTKIIAAQLGMTPQALNLLLKRLGVQYKQDGVWFLYGKHIRKGYHGYKTWTDPDEIDTPVAKNHMYWTETGRRAIINLVNAYREKIASQQQVAA